MARKSADCFRMVAMESTRISWVILACLALGFSALKTYWGKKSRVSVCLLPAGRLQGPCAVTDLYEGAQVVVQTFLMALGHDVQENPGEKCGLCSARNTRASSSTSQKQKTHVSHPAQPQKPLYWHSLICRETVLAGQHPHTELLHHPCTKHSDEVPKASPPHLCWPRNDPDKLTFNTQDSLHEEVGQNIVHYNLIPPCIPGIYSF